MVAIVLAWREHVFDLEYVFDRYEQILSDGLFGKEKERRGGTSQTSGKPMNEHIGSERTKAYSETRDHQPLIDGKEETPVPDPA